MTPSPPPNEQASWNEAYERLRHFLESFALGDRTQIPRIALHILEEARTMHRHDPSCPPVSITMEQAQKRIDEWFKFNLEVEEKSPSQLLSAGYLALLFSPSLREDPQAFLQHPLPEHLHREMSETLLVTGPDLNVSSMTPRHLDYGPMEDLARTTWQRFNLQELIIAILFWTGVYFAFYWWLSELL